MRKLPAEITANVVPFIHGEGFTHKALGDIVRTVKELTGDLDMTTRSRKLVADFRRDA